MLPGHQWKQNPCQLQWTGEVQAVSVSLTLLFHHSTFYTFSHPYSVHFCIMKSHHPILLNHMLSLRTSFVLHILCFECTLQEGTLFTCKCSTRKVSAVASPLPRSPMEKQGSQYWLRREHQQARILCSGYTLLLPYLRAFYLLLNGFHMCFEN